MNSGAMPFLSADTSLHATLSTYCSVVILNPRSLRILTAIVAASATLSMIACNVKPNLDDFFHSNFFLGWVVLEGCATFVTLIAFIVYGISLRQRLVAFLSNRASVARDGTGRVSIMQRSVNKMMIVLVCSTLGFFSRICALVIKLTFYADAHSDSDGAEGDADARSVHLYSVSYFIFADFIPRGLGTLSFLMLIGASENARPGSERNSNRPSSFFWGSSLGKWLYAWTPRPTNGNGDMNGGRQRMSSGASEASASDSDRGSGFAPNRPSFGSSGKARLSADSDIINPLTGAGTDMGRGSASSQNGNGRTASFTAWEEAVDEGIEVEMRLSGVWVERGSAEAEAEADRSKSHESDL